MCYVDPRCANLAITRVINTLGGSKFCSRSMYIWREKVKPTKSGFLLQYMLLKFSFAGLSSYTRVTPKYAVSPRACFPSCLLQQNIPTRCALCLIGFARRGAAAGARARADVVRARHFEPGTIIKHRSFLPVCVCVRVCLCFCLCICRVSVCLYVHAIVT